MKRISSDIRNRTFEPVYLIYGPEAYLRREAKKALRGAICGKDTMNYTYREGRDASIPEIREIAATLPFFAEKRLIVLENTGLAKKGGEALAEYLPDMPATTVLVLVEAEIDRRSKLVKAVEQYGHAAECARESERDRKRRALSGFAKAGRAITYEAMNLFLQRCGGDLDSMFTEMEKLIAYTEGKDGIRIGDVEAVTAVTPQDRVFDMIDAVTAGRPKEAYRMYEDLVSAGQPPMRILYLIFQHVNRLLQAKDWTERGEWEDGVAGKMGLKPFAGRKYVRQAARFSREELEKRLEKMAAYDSDIKNGRIRDKMALELVLADFSRKEKA